MAGRPKIYDEEKALDKAIEVFWEKGYENASADDLLKAMGIGKGSFYLAYKGGKQELFEKSLKRVVNHHMEGLRQALKNSAHPLEVIKEVFFTIADPQSQFGKHGCYFANAVLQVEDKSLKCAAADQLQLLKGLFIDALKREKAAGNLRSDVSPELLGTHLLNLWNGLHITKATVSPEELKELIELNLKIIE